MTAQFLWTRQAGLCESPALTVSLQRDAPIQLDLSIEDNVAGFLGISLERHEDRCDPDETNGLIDRNLAVVNLEDSKVYSLPEYVDHICEEGCH